MAMDVIDYQVFGSEMQFVEVELDPGEAAIGEAGSLMYMDGGIAMDTVFGDGSAQQGGLLICQRDAFLCAARGVSLGIALQKKLSTGFFGGEGFIMQKLEGDGLAFVHAGGTVVRRELHPGQSLMVDTGCVVAYTPSINFEIQYVGKIKTALFGGEGLFLARMTGPGTVWLQSLPFSRLASRVFAAAPQTGGGRREESALGGLAAGGILGSLLGGDGEDA